MNCVSRVAVCALAFIALFGRITQRHCEERVRDSHGQPVPAVTVQLKTGNQTLTSKSDAAGIYNSPSLTAATYTLHAEGKRSKAKQHSDRLPFQQMRTRKSISRCRREARVLRPTYVHRGGRYGHPNQGGHGSDVILRSSEALTKAAAALGDLKRTARQTRWKLFANTNAPRNRIRASEISSIGARNCWPTAPMARPLKSSPKAVAYFRIPRGCCLDSPLPITQTAPTTRPLSDSLKLPISIRPIPALMFLSQNAKQCHHRIRRLSRKNGPLRKTTSRRMPGPISITPPALETERRGSRKSHGETARQSPPA